MSTISASTTTTTAYKVTADTTGTLVLQTGSTPTTAVTIGTDQVVTFAKTPTSTGSGSVATNTAYGTSALAANTSGASNTALGYQAGNALTTASDNTFVGTQAGLVATGATNTGVGSASLGRNAGSTTGTNNAALGAYALTYVTSGAYNTALGTSALQNNTTASNNTAVGYQAGYTNTTGINRTCVGSLAGYSGTAATSSTCVGYYAGYSSTGTDNTFIGTGAGYVITSGAKNTILGGFSGNQGLLDIRTASNNIVLSDGDGNPRGYFKNTGATYGYWHFEVNDNTRNIEFDGNQFYPQPDNTMKLGFPSLRWTTVYATTGTINTSDANTKQDIAALDDAERRVAVAIKSLIKKYRFKDAVAEKGDAARIHIGAVAQEVQAAFVAEGLDPARYALFCSDTWYEVDGKAGKPAEPYTAETPNAVQVTRLGLRYEELLAFVIAAL